MAIAAAGVVQASRAQPLLGSNLHIVFVDVTLTGSYTANGDVLTAAFCGLSTIEFALPGTFSDSVSAPALVWPVSVNYVAGGASCLLVLGESAADGDPLDEKPAEAVTAGTQGRVMVIGKL